MKVLAIVLLCVVAAVQGRSAGVQVQSSRDTELALGDVRHLVHLRIAIGTSGLLQTAVGSFVGSNWVITAASGVRDSRFIWIRMGVVNVIYPSMVIESNAVTSNPGYVASTGANNIALLNVNRIVVPTVNIAPLPALGGSLNSNENFYGFGQDESGRPGEQLRSYELSLIENEGVYSGSSSQGAISRFDIGAPVVSDGQQTGLLVAVDDEGVGSFQAIAEYVPWIESVTNLDFSQPEA